MDELVSIRIPRNAMGKLHRLKAKLIMARERKVSDAEVVAEALEIALSEKQSTLASRKVDLIDYCGFISGGGKSNAAVDHDEVIYGWTRK